MKNLFQICCIALVLGVGGFVAALPWMSAPRTVAVFQGRGGWWARVDRPGVVGKRPAEFMERGPYPFGWMARRAFPIQRWTW